MTARENKSGRSTSRKPAVCARAATARGVRGADVAVDVLDHDDDESAMMPKSTAPIDRRLADLPRRNNTAKANNSASGMLMAR